MKKLFFILILFASCKKNIDPSFEESNFPDEIESIIVTKCATKGCHNNDSYQNASNLNLTTWNKMFEGGVNGSVAIPFCKEQSSLIQFVNTYTDLGTIATPTMPLNNTPLSKEEVKVLQNWVQNGCPNKNGEIPFEKNYRNRKKAYICNQGCDVVSVIDIESNLVIRYINVGHDNSNIELPHGIKMDYEGKYWYVCFNNGNYVQKFDAATDTLVGEVMVGLGNWNVISISSNNKIGYVTDLASNGKLVQFNLETMQIIKTYSGSGLLVNPHGIALSMTNDTIYVSAQYGNMIYRIIPNATQIDILPIEKNAQPVTTPQMLDPHELLMSPDYSKYFITCEASNEVRVMDAKNDTLLKVIPVGIYPKAMTISKLKNWLFVTCQEDNSVLFPNLKVKGTVYVIDINTLEVVKVIDEKFYQPHGIAVDDRNGYLYIVSRNSNPNGPAPHHASSCGGRNGFFHVIDINSWKVLKRNIELSTDPYNMDIR